MTVSLRKSGSMSELYSLRDEGLVFLHGKGVTARKQYPVYPKLGMDVSPDQETQAGEEKNERGSVRFGNGGVGNAGKSRIIRTAHQSRTGAREQDQPVFVGKTKGSGCDIESVSLVCCHNRF